MIGMYSIHVQNYVKTNLINNEKHTHKLLLFFYVANQSSFTLDSLLSLSLKFPSVYQGIQREQGIFVLRNSCLNFPSPYHMESG